MNNIIPIKAFNDNYIWLLVNSQNNTAVCVDPGDAQPVIEQLTKLNLKLVAILITHHHYDHTGGIANLLQHYSVPVYGPAREDISQLSTKLLENDKVELAELNLKYTVIEIPGHTLGHIAYVGEGAVFCGDTLFAGGCGRVFEGTAAQMYQSLDKLAQLPEKTKVYCAHEYTEANLRFAAMVEPGNIHLKQRIIDTAQLRETLQPTLPSTIGLEKATNPFFRCIEPTVIQAAEQHVGHKLGDAVAVFAVIRQWKDNF